MKVSAAITHVRFLIVLVYSSMVVVVLGLSAFDLWLWRIPLLQRWFVTRPVIQGTGAPNSNPIGLNSTSRFRRERAAVRTIREMASTRTRHHQLRRRPPM